MQNGRRGPASEKRTGLPKTAGLTLGLHESKNVTSADGALDVADDGTVVVVQELDADLGDTTAAASAAEDLNDTGQGTLSLLLLNDFRTGAGLWSSRDGRQGHERSDDAT